MDKKEVRKIITEKKKLMSSSEIDERSAELAGKFCALDEYKNSECIYVYIPYNQEVRTEYLIEQAFKDKKRVAVPLMLASGKELDKNNRPKADYMEFIYITDLTELKPNSMGISEPDQDIIVSEPGRIADEKDVLILMPGLAFDNYGGRIGYGGGFYDKYISSHKDTHFTRIALCFDFQLLEEKLPMEEHDEKIDKVITA